MYWMTWVTALMREALVIDFTRAQYHFWLWTILGIHYIATATLSHLPEHQQRQVGSIELLGGMMTLCVLPNTIFDSGSFSTFGRAL